MVVYPKWMLLHWKIPFKWMIWGYPYFRKPLYGESMVTIIDWG